MKVYFLKKLILHRSDIRERNESQNTEGYSEQNSYNLADQLGQTHAAPDVFTCSCTPMICPMHCLTPQAHKHHQLCSSMSVFKFPCSCSNAHLCISLPHTWVSSTAKPHAFTTSSRKHCPMLPAVCTAPTCHATSLYSASHHNTMLCSSPHAH